MSEPWFKGRRVLWPNGVEGEVAAVDFDSWQIMDHAGGWHDMSDVDALPAEFGNIGADGVQS